MIFAHSNLRRSWMLCAGMAVGEKPLKWLPVRRSAAVNRATADPQPKGWGE